MNYVRWTDKKKVSKLQKLYESGEDISLIARMLDEKKERVYHKLYYLRRAGIMTARRYYPEETFAHKFKFDKLDILGLALYWGEGTKRGRVCEFCNSSPEMISIFLKFLKRLPINKERLAFRLFLYENSDRESSLNFWSETCGVAANKILIVTKKSDNKWNRHNLPHGTLSVRYYSISLHKTVLKGIERLKEMYSA